MEQYYIQNKEAGYLGNSPVFWAKDSRGYTSYLENCHKYTYDEAKKICENNPKKNKAWPCSYIESKRVSIVDIQYLESENIINFKAMGYVKTFTIPEMISKCENNSHKLLQVQNDELRRIKENYAKMTVL